MNIPALWPDAATWTCSECDATLAYLAGDRATADRLRGYHAASAHGDGPMPNDDLEGASLVADVDGACFLVTPNSIHVLPPELFGDLEPVTLLRDPAWRWWMSAADCECHHLFEAHAPAFGPCDLCPCAGFELAPSDAPTT
jgi:hypothetical protein